MFCWTLNSSLGYSKLTFRLRYIHRLDLTWLWKVLSSQRFWIPFCIRWGVVWSWNFLAILTAVLIGLLNSQIPPKIPLAQQADLAREMNLKTPLCYDKRTYVTTLSKEERQKHLQFTQKTILREEVSVATSYYRKSLTFSVFSMSLLYLKISRPMMFAAWLWLKMNYRDVNHSSEFFQHQTATSISTLLMRRGITTTCWTHGNIDSAKSVTVELHYWERCAGSESISRFRQQLFRRYVEVQWCQVNYSPRQINRMIRSKICKLRLY